MCLHVFNLNVDFPDLIELLRYLSNLLEITYYDRSTDMAFSGRCRYIGHSWADSRYFQNY